MNPVKLIKPENHLQISVHTLVVSIFSFVVGSVLSLKMRKILSEPGMQPYPIDLNLYAEYLNIFFIAVLFLLVTSLLNFICYKLFSLSGMEKKSLSGFYLRVYSMVFIVFVLSLFTVSIYMLNFIMASLGSDSGPVFGSSFYQPLSDYSTQRQEILLLVFLIATYGYIMVTLTLVAKTVVLFSYATTNKHKLTYKKILLVILSALILLLLIIAVNHFRRLYS